MKKAINLMVAGIILLSTFACIMGLFSAGGPGEYTYRAITGENVGIGNTFFTPDNSSLLEIRGNKGVLFPRITTAERDAINNPAQSLVIFNSTTQCFETYINNSWQVIKCFSCQGTVNYFGISYTMVPVGSQCS